MDAFRREGRFAIVMSRGRRNGGVVACESADLEGFSMANLVLCIMELLTAPLRDFDTRLERI